MIRRPYAASYEVGRGLVAAGCPLDYLDSLPRNPASHLKRLYIGPLNGYVESRIYMLGPCDAAFVIALSIGTEIRSGIIVSDWSFVLPWDQFVRWDYSPRDVVPQQDHGAYKHLFDSPLSAVLNERRILTRRRPVEGLLCGRAFEPFPESLAGGETVHAEFTVTDAESGRTATSPITLRVDRSAFIEPLACTSKRTRLFDSPDLPDVQHTTNDNYMVIKSNSKKLRAEVANFCKETVELARRSRSPHGTRPRDDARRGWHAAKPPRVACQS
jgi:hypothetical protein